MSPYLAKCKRLRDDGPTPCLCCPRECVGDDPTIMMLPEVEAMLKARERPAFPSLPLYAWVCGLGPTVLLLLALYARARGWW